MFQTYWVAAGGNPFQFAVIIPVHNVTVVTDIILLLTFVKV